MQKRKFIVIIWHQAGGRDDNQTFYTWDDEQSEAAIVFDSAKKAIEAWCRDMMHEVHAGFVVEVTANAQTWI